MTKPPLFDDAMKQRLSEDPQPVWLSDQHGAPHMLVWANEPGLQLWRSPTLEHLRARDLSDETGVTARSFDAYYKELCGNGINIRWSIYPDGEPITLGIHVRAISLPDGREIMWVRAWENQPRLDPDIDRLYRSTHYATMPVSVFGADHRLLVRNGAAGSCYAGETEGSELRRRFVDDDVYDRMCSLLKDGNTYSTEALMRTAEGDRWHSFEAVNAMDPATGNRIIFVHEASIERARRAEADLGAALEQLKATQTQLVLTQKLASLSDLVAGVAHEMNTPIAVIQSSAAAASKSLERLRSADVDEKLIDRATDAHRLIREATQRLSNTVDMLRKFARLDQAAWAQADVNEEMQRTLELTRHRIPEQAHVVLELGDVPQMRCQPRQLNQVFASLIVNAAEAIEPTGRITIRSELDGDSVVIEVSDDGVGIALADLERVFDPGFTTKGVGVGTGLGLAVAYGIVRDHGGKLLVMSAGPGHGTQARVTLPCG